MNGFLQDKTIPQSLREFCHNIHDIRRFPEFHDRRIACKNRCFHIFKFILERIRGATPASMMVCFLVSSVNNDSMIGSGIFHNFDICFFTADHRAFCCFECMERATVAIWPEGFISRMDAVHHILLVPVFIWLRI